MSELQTNKPKRSHAFFLKVGLAVAVLVFALVIGLNKFKEIMIGRAIANMPEKANPVTAMTVAPREWTPVINTTGLVRPNQGAMLSAQSAGTIKKIFVTSGQTVKKGDVLVELDSDVEIATLKASEAQLPAARLTYQRYANLIKSQSVSQTELDNAKASYDQLVANINSLKATIERRKILAPFDGVTGIVQVNEGQYISVGTEIVRVEDVSSMKVDFSVSQNDLENLQIGQKVTATSDARQGETFAAKVTAIEPAINKSTGLIDVQATFEAEDGKKLLSGMFTRLRLALPTEREQIVVPQVAITYNMYGEMAYVLQSLSDEDKEKLKDNEDLNKMYRAQQITVFTKDRQGIYAQLKGNEVKAGDIIVTGGQQRLSNGSLVTVADKEGVGTVQPANKTNL
ncbi:efflux RND transporter periplasmic adaptor subunit [Bisgaard Taxon 10/6]|uniref:multidrug efflux RND transporter periplasmic adaptor subunit AcrA n=1 Tax=Exercitatus varius TaxID=67857 RepID=UPI00294B6F13|nr:efflux RND transporter periplasmic adaptor subunit [Exercitatus varius]MDG2915612.1 efflux RND transporter periplasmic adaptor subunit [Exercitatus varius]MDG2943311.1 efflux RND transporter periplasmic adaptor subunit [Exercitatus varius]MDG2947253.1 efflux RND transporter periplasmic adaptor subunit [Exercitatus varius]MDG2956076.1 efflux RND transporter periplasmic adaptor subunit [Exercitatus varius]MDG2962087.1 efflux RND transporter periplasmic adaptor subunit [Exercitatus varius]